MNGNKIADRSKPWRAKLENMMRNLSTSDFRPIALVSFKKRHLAVTRAFNFGWTERIFPPLIVHRPVNDNGVGK